MLARVRSKRPSGVTAVIVGILLVVLAMFLALVINVGHGHLIRSELQNAADAAALAAAVELDGAATGIADATARAVEFARRHETDAGMEINLDPALGDVEFGRWHDSSRTFDPIVPSPSTYRSINAVRVTASRTTREAGNSPMPVAMGGLFGKYQQDVKAEAIAVYGGPCEDGCTLPIVFPDCLILDAYGNLKCNEALEFSSANIDDIAWTSLDPELPANPPTTISILNGTSCHGAVCGEVIRIQNGNGVNPVLDALEQYEGKTVSAPIIDMDCPPQFVQAHEIMGFATFTFEKVLGPPDNYLRIKLDCSAILPEPADPGCEFFGTTPQDARLVR